MTLSDDIKRVLELDSKRRQVEWAVLEKSDSGHCCFEWSIKCGVGHVCEGWGEEKDFIASAPLMASIIRQQQELLREAYEALEFAQPCVKPMRIPAVDERIAGVMNKIKTALGDV